MHFLLYIFKIYSFKLHGVMRTVEEAKIIHIVRVLYIELVFRPLSSSHPEGGKNN